ncbi:type II toxin-antitoxin system RelE/ParE family toxin [Oxalobacteraceae bacterium A2-2]
MKRVLRTATYLAELQAIAAHVARFSPRAAAELWLHIDSQVGKLADPNFPRRTGRVPGTIELAAHRNYIVVLREDQVTVTALPVLHARRKYP